MTEKELMHNTGYVLRKLRLQRDESQMHVADATDINRASYCYMETGRRDIKLSDIATLAEYYSMKPHELVVMIEKGQI